MIRAEALASRPQADSGGRTAPKGRLRWDPVLSADEEHELAERIKGGDEDARRELILANLRMVLEIARKFRGGKLPLDDLVQEGNLGLIRASADFDPSVHGCRFYTYAEIWIKGFIHRALARNGSLIRVPERVFVQRQQGLRAMRAPGQGGGAAERAETTNPPHGAVDVWGDPVAPGRRDADVPDGSGQGPDPMVLDAAEIVSLAEAIVDHHQPDQQVVEQEQRILLELALRRLNPVEAWVVRERYGLGLLIPDEWDWSSPRIDADSRDEPEDEVNARGRRRAVFHRTYHELARACGLSVHRIRQVEETALEKLRDVLHPCLIPAL
jgi:RNA polymerase sigma factor (sigma-70 family)